MSTIDSLGLHQYIDYSSLTALATVTEGSADTDAQIVELLRTISEQRISFDNLEITGTVNQFDLGTLEPKIDLINNYLANTLTPSLGNLATQATLNSIDGKLSGFATQQTSLDILAAIGQLIATSTANASGGSSIDISTLAKENTLTIISNKIDSLGKNSVLQSILSSINGLAKETSLQTVINRLGTVITSLSALSSGGGGSTIDISTLAKTTDITQLRNSVDTLSQKLSPTVTGVQVSTQAFDATVNTTNFNASSAVPDNCYSITVINNTASRGGVIFPFGTVIIPAYGTYNINHELSESPLTAGAVTIAIAGNVGDNTPGGDPPYVGFNYHTITTS